ncbi:MAG: prepilin-type N-terminal cleavage/methylation domain-containing protein [Candidatus Nealsonbacteria bacterium]|nr:prepilin-type N-terminal cleavage/methylation domain-containing protein [Candidatus Nealsonbacteria bacterium]
MKTKKFIVSKPPSRPQKGFLLLEVIVAIFLVTVGIAGAIIAIQQLVTVTEIASSQMIGSYLAQEGMEIVRNIRDSNWLGGRAWNAGIFCCSPPPCDCQADYRATSLVSFIPGEFLRIDGGFYKYSATGPLTPFIRRIRVASTTVDRIDLTVFVDWQERGINYQASTTKHLYNWR